jgi:hypothetical protein
MGISGRQSAVECAYRAGQYRRPNVAVGEQDARRYIEHVLDIAIEGPSLIELDNGSSLSIRRTESPGSETLVLEARKCGHWHNECDPAVRLQVPFNATRKEIARQVLMRGNLATNPQSAALTGFPEPMFHLPGHGVESEPRGVPDQKVRLTVAQAQPQRTGEITYDVRPDMIAPCLMQRPHPFV